MTDNEIQKAYKPQDVAKILLCNRKTVIRMLRSGRLKGFKIGTNWRISAKSLEEYMNGNKK